MMKLLVVTLSVNRVLRQGMKVSAVLDTVPEEDSRRVTPFMVITCILWKATNIIQCHRMSVKRISQEREN